MSSLDGAAVPFAASKKRQRRANHHLRYSRMPSAAVVKLIQIAGGYAGISPEQAKAFSRPHRCRT